MHSKSEPTHITRLIWETSSWILITLLIWGTILAILITSLISENPLTLLRFFHAQFRLSLCVKALWDWHHRLQGHHIGGLPLQSSCGKETTWHQPNPSFNHGHSASKPSVCGQLSLLYRLCPILCIQKRIWLAKGSAGSLNWDQAVLTELFFTLLVILYL